MPDKEIDTMTPRERILAILHRRPVDRLPVDLWYTPEIGARFRQHCGVAVTKARHACATFCRDRALGVAF
ncbi:MAG: hypothetical protein ABSG78_04485 [Verrucomicrobiota bacterium]|jgi:hypothetical protein